MAIGMDCGTFNLVVARRGEDKNEIKFRKEVNAFLDVHLEQRHAFNMLKASGVPLIEREKVAYIVGDAAVNFAYAMPQLSLKRPMKDGCLNPAEKDAFRILSIMMHSLIGEVDKDKDVLYYSVPANAVNKTTDADYHQKILESILKAYKVNGKTITPYAINEGLALIYAELGHKAFTGVGISFGGGMVNFCYSIFSHPVFNFSIVNSGDWIDEQAAKASGETQTTINKLKQKIDLTKMPTNIAERAIQGQYRIMIERTVSEIKKAILEAGNSVRVENPIDIIIGGGTSSPNGFVEIFQEVVKSMDFPVPIGDIRKPEDHLYSVAKGCLIAAEMAQ
jgi:hypothetical protein